MCDSSLKFEDSANSKCALTITAERSVVEACNAHHGGTPIAGRQGRHEIHAAHYLFKCNIYRLAVRQKPKNDQQ